MNGKSNPETRQIVARETMEAWQAIVNIMAELIDVPAGLIMRVDQEDIEVFVSSQTEGNPYSPGDREHLAGSGLYCEWVVNNRKKLLVPNALEDPQWDENPDIKLNMISYLGLPILLPTGEVFGTMCVLDTKRNAYAPLYGRLLANFRNLIERDLSLQYVNRELDAKNRSLESALAEIKTLRGIIPICAHCKSIRDDAGFWHAVEKYITERSAALFSHSICPGCMDTHYPDYVPTEA